MAYFWQRKKAEDGAETLEIPKELEDQIKAGAEAKEKIGKVEQLVQSLVDIQQKNTDERRKAEAEAVAAAARKNREETEGTLEEQIEALMLEGKTKQAIELANRGTNEAILAVRADNIRREVFEDAEKFEYYSGDIKREVDALIASQHVTFRQNPANIENCYHTVLGKHTKEIVEGKLKSRFAGGTDRSTNNGNASDSSSSKDKKDRNFDTEGEANLRKAAKQSGIKYEDYVELLEKEGVL
jgi:hypothetical protein